jgi:RimJ/RimL family protein N-acetyltransferase
VGTACLLRYARDVLGRDRVISLVHAENAASIRVALRLGALPDGAIDLNGRPAQV